VLHVFRPLVLKTLNSRRACPARVETEAGTTETGLKVNFSDLNFIGIHHAEPWITQAVVTADA
jgi:hypothetical protein